MRQPKAKTVTVRTPGKLILSGEHAVVYGNPALAMAVNRFTETRISGQKSQNILFNLLNLRYHQSQSLPFLRHLKHTIQNKYEKFLQGHYGIRDVLKEPFELLQYAVAHFIDNRKLDLPNGIEIHTESNIPIGCGMGSSAASVVSVMYAIANFLQKEVDLNHCHQLAWEAENIQHGHSSGVDIYLVLNGGCIIFQKNADKKTLSVPTQSLLLANTGSPMSSTGECVAHAAPYLKNDPELLQEFSDVTQTIAQGLQENSLPLLQEGVKQNHQLLVKIGVVPLVVQKFIADIENNGGAAKICGAGSVTGDAAGMVFIAGNQDYSDILRRYNFSSLYVQGVSQGTHIL